MIYFDQAIETMPRERLRELQLEKLQAMLKRLYGHNRFYTAKLKAAGAVPEDIQSLDDLSRLPLTTKDELLEAQADDPPFGTNATFPEAAYVRVHQTSGTSGTRLWVPDTYDSWEWLGKCWAYTLAGAGLTADDRLFVSSSFGTFMAFWAAVEGARQVGAMMIPGGGRSSLERLHLMRELGATALCSTPTYALRLAAVASEAGISLSDIPIHIMIHGGEPGASLPATKARIQDTWGAKCFDCTGAADVGHYGFECEVQPGGVHVIESEFIVEVHDPATGEPVPPSEPGELVITNLGRIGFPVIRYRTGDQVKLETAPCECGRTFGRLAGGIIGRVDDALVIRGVLLFPSAIENVIRRSPEVDEFAVDVYRKGELDEMEIRVEISGAEPDALADAVANEFRSEFGLRVQVTPVPHDTLPRFEIKAKRLTDHRQVISESESA